MEVVRHKQFVKQMKKLPLSLRKQVLERTILHSENPSYPLLHDHKLNPPFDGYRSINITGDYRLVYKKLDAETYYLRAIGTHHELYGS
ncbi:MAG: type II toxin-antitoxin system mRNA interferase toxin, RelE/StbE family [Minisyncoccia bacterium]